jgi:hypothetical protein
MTRSQAPADRVPWSERFAELAAVLGMVALSLTAAAQVPQQAQASTLAVPDPQTYEYSSAILVTQCHQVGAVIFVGKDGTLYPQHFQDMTTAQLMQELSKAAPPNRVIAVAVPCPNETTI